MVNKLGSRLVSGHRFEIFYRILNMENILVDIPCPIFTKLFNKFIN